MSLDLGKKVFCRLGVKAFNYNFYKYSTISAQVSICCLLNFKPLVYFIIAQPKILLLEDCKPFHQLIKKEFILNKFLNNLLILNCNY